jgi:hypothetical protein
MMTLALDATSSWPSVAPAWGQHGFGLHANANQRGVELVVHVHGNAFALFFDHVGAVSQQAAAFLVAGLGALNGLAQVFGAGLDLVFKLLAFHGQALGHFDDGGLQLGDFAIGATAGAGSFICLGIKGNIELAQSNITQRAHDLM